MSSCRLLPILGICCAMYSTEPLHAAEATDVQQQFSAMEQALAPPQEVHPVGYAEVEAPVEQSQYIPAPASSDVYPYDPTCSAACCDTCYDPLCRPSYWTFGIDFIPTELHITDSEFGRWNEDSGFAMRLKLGYENEAGYGIRAQAWGFGEEASPEFTDVDVGAGTFNLDFYKRFWGRNGDLAIGVSPTGAGLSFELPDHSESRFSGGGVGLFADGYFNVVHFKKSDLGIVGRGRVSLLEGRWRDTTGFVVPETNHDSMLILEAAWGLEYRRRFGCREDKLWYIGLLSEIQQWDSQWMGNYLDSSAGFTGLNLELGVAW